MRLYKNTYTVEFYTPHQPRLGLGNDMPGALYEQFGPGVMQIYGNLKSVLIETVEVEDKE